jgi:osmotically inducible protein OsmC
MNRAATAVWTGSLRDGKGALATDSGVLANTPYSFKTRFENEKGTNPEELIAAAHAGCFTMALSAQLATMQLTPEHLETKATATLEKIGDAWTVSKVHLDLTGRVPGASQATFESAAASAKANCPISRLLKADITLSTKLEHSAQSRTAE